MDANTTSRATETILEAYYKGGVCRIRFDGSGWQVLEDTRPGAVGGYLHVTDESAEAVTDACRDQMLRYFFHPDCAADLADIHKPCLPALGATPQSRYFVGVSREYRMNFAPGGRMPALTAPCNDREQIVR